MILFLDFDGVLHGVGRPKFENLPRLEAVLRDFPEIDVVISSSWRESYSWDVIVDFFAEDLQPRIVGMTPVIATKWPPYPRQVRHEEILLFLKERDIGNRPWIILDDDPSLFCPDCKELMLCDPGNGLDEAGEARLRARLHLFTRGVTERKAS